jgi:hypothetical protein
MTVIDILKRFLRRGGYDGLCHPDTECGCWLDDLVPCDGPIDWCQPGITKTRSPECETTCALAFDCTGRCVVVPVRRQGIDGHGQRAGE